MNMDRFQPPGTFEDRYHETLEDRIEAEMRKADEEEERFDAHLADLGLDRDAELPKVDPDVVTDVSLLLD